MQEDLYDDTKVIYTVTNSKMMDIESKDALEAHRGSQQMLDA